MSVRRLAPAEVQPSSFAFTGDNHAFADAEVAKYPDGRHASAVIALLWRAQKQHGGWLPKAAMEAVGERLGMPFIRVLEVATFYTMFNLEPVGRWFIQLCGTVPCHVMGALDLKQILLEKVGDAGHVTAEGTFSWAEVECLGACCNAPMVQINDEYYEDLTPELLVALIDDLAAGRKTKVGPQAGRRSSEPAGEATTLRDEALFDGSLVGGWRSRFDERPVAPPNDGAATASGPNDPKPAKPDAGRAEHKAVADAPAQRAADGASPAPATARDVAPEPGPKPQSGKSYTMTPSRADEGRAAAGSDGTTPEAGSPSTGASERGAGSADKPIGADPTAQPGTAPDKS